MLISLYMRSNVLQFSPFFTFSFFYDFEKYPIIKNVFT